MTDVTFESLIATSAGFDQHKTDFRVRASALCLDHDGKLVVDAPPLPYDDSTPNRNFDASLRVVGLTDHARRQLHDKLGQAHYGRGSNKVLPTEYLSHFSHAMYADILNWTFLRSQSTWKVRTYDDSARAILDGQYPRIWNTEVLRQLRRTLTERNGIDGLRADRSFVTPDELFVRLWWQDTGTGNYRVGMGIGNGEVGNRAFEGYPMIQRTSCQNSILVTDRSVFTGGAAGFRFVHYAGVSAESLMVQFYAQLPALLNASGTLVNKMIEAEGVTLPDFHSVLQGLAIEHDWKADMLDLVDAGTEGQRTVAGIVNGVTFAAHESLRLTEPERVSLEIVGGNYLFSSPKEFARLAEQGRVGKRVRV